MLQMEFVACNAPIWCCKWTIKVKCCKYLLWCQLYPADWLVAGLWRQLNSCRNQTAAAALSGEVEWSTTIYSAAHFFLRRCSNSTAWISAEKALGLGILLRQSHTCSFSSYPTKLFAPPNLWKYFANFCGRVKKQSVPGLWKRWLGLPRPTG